MYCAYCSILEFVCSSKYKTIEDLNLYNSYDSVHRNTDADNSCYVSPTYNPLACGWFVIQSHILTGRIRLCSTTRNHHERVTTILCTRVRTLKLRRQNVSILRTARVRSHVEYCHRSIRRGRSFIQQTHTRLCVCASAHTHHICSIVRSRRMRSEHVSSICSTVLSPPCGPSYPSSLAYRVLSHA